MTAIKSPSTPPGELPVVMDRLQQFDADNSGGLNASELETIANDPTTMGAMDVDIEFAWSSADYKSPAGFENPRVSYKQAAEVLDQLNPTLRSSVVRSLSPESNYNPKVSNGFVKALMSRNAELFADDLARDYPNNDFTKDPINSAHLLLRDLSEGNRSAVMEKLSEKHPEFAKALIEYKASVEEAERNFKLRGGIWFDNPNTNQSIDLPNINIDINDFDGGDNYYYYYEPCQDSEPAIPTYIADPKDSDDYGVESTPEPAPEEKPTPAP